MPPAFRTPFRVMLSPDGQRVPEHVWRLDDESLFRNPELAGKQRGDRCCSAIRRAGAGRYLILEVS